MPDAPEIHPPVVPPEGSLGLLAYGHEGLLAWRRARGDGWKAELRAVAEAQAPAEPRPRPERRSAPPAPDPDALAAATITVVTGLPRSGTSMAMQMLAAGGVPPFTDAARPADESNPRGYLEHDRVRALARDASWLADADGHALKVVVPLLPHLPPGPAYRVVWVERPLEEVLASQARMLDRLGHAAGDADALRALFARQTRDAERWAAETPRVRTLRLAYHDAVRDPAAAARAVAAFLDLDAAAMAAAIDPALHRERA